MDPVSAIKLIRTDTTLDLSQKAEKGMMIICVFRTMNLSTTEGALSMTDTPWHVAACWATDIPSTGSATYFHHSRRNYFRGYFTYTKYDYQGSSNQVEQHWDLSCRPLYRPHVAANSPLSRAGCYLRPNILCRIDISCRVTFAKSYSLFLSHRAMTSQVSVPRLPKSVVTVPKNSYKKRQALLKAPSGKTFYFAYGANLNPTVVKNRKLAPTQTIAGHVNNCKLYFQHIGGMRLFLCSMHR
jgi:hypothetical protein